MPTAEFKSRTAGLRFQRMEHIISAIIVISFLLTGCAAIQNQMVKTYEFDYHDTVQASSDTLKDLEIPVTQQMSDGLKTVINAKRFDGSPVMVEVVRINQDLTEVSVKTGKGLVPDERVSTQIHEFINENLTQQAENDKKQTGVSGEKGDRGSLGNAAEQEIIEEELATAAGNQGQSASASNSGDFFADSGFLIFFNKDSNELTPRAMEKLDRIFEIFSAKPDVEIVLSGYTDSYGKPSYNKVVSEKRANAVKDYLAEKGVPSFKMRTMGYGAQKFLGSNRTQEGRRFNRRVEIELHNLSTD